MSQNILDNPAFWSRYRALPQSTHGLSSACEWPSVQRILGPIKGLRCLDLGCGEGFFCQWAIENGAFSVLGIDISENMLESARQRRNEMQIAWELSTTYQQGDLETVVLKEKSYDLVVSMMVMHYLSDEAFLRLLREVYKALTPGGKFVFSIVHPLHDSSYTKIDGTLDACMDIYMEGLRERKWLGTSVKKYHRMVCTYTMMVLEAGFKVKTLKNVVTEADGARRFMDDWVGKEKPMYLVLQLEKQSAQAVNSSKQRPLWEDIRDILFGISRERLREKSVEGHLIEGTNPVAGIHRTSI